eukprot:CAMPEP_0197631944 /NCGR_PEP_ID=MMETSP1338-20131121/8931_1 /TAXON_ID=43686 ORGANISM="Pelagodinium beii, Strain RCC1491" /NCGR_SAMPLE_ID=MMETSP1338 /ASSEMBLY_ACC=CAM_ASM_000754 /LENGTH=184 /DNA_ID=CAMNT_0043203489 /DNA_START=675 /DNA_END=1229 /DNA_ORIENTATION=+
MTVGSLRTSEEPGWGHSTHSNVTISPSGLCVTIPELCITILPSLNTGPVLSQAASCARALSEIQLAILLYLEATTAAEEESTSDSSLMHPRPGKDSRSDMMSSVASGGSGSGMLFGEADTPSGGVGKTCDSLDLMCNMCCKTSDGFQSFAVPILMPANAEAASRWPCGQATAALEGFGGGSGPG